jgi:nucleoside-diphosphate kinase
MEKTFGIIKPNATKKNIIGKILNLIEEDGFKIVAAQMKTLTKAEAEGFYAEHKERPFFGSLCSFMTSGPVLVFVLKLQVQWKNTVSSWELPTLQKQPRERFENFSVKA